MSDDDVRAGLRRAAGAVTPPEDSVGRVRATVARRRRRRSAVRVGSAAAGATTLLIAAVVLAPGLRAPEATLPAGPPSPEATVTATGPVLGPDGFEGLRLGEPFTPAEQDFETETASGCDFHQVSWAEDLLGAPAAGANQVSAWERDGEVQVISVAAQPDRVRVEGDSVVTWLGPALRTPLSDALSLPGATLVTDEARDGAPAVANVVVPRVGGGELVLSDAPIDGTQGDGRVTVITLRTEAGVDCRPSLADVVAPVDGASPSAEVVAMGPDGTAEVPLGGSVSAGVTADVLVPSDVPAAEDMLTDPLDGRGCTRFDTADDAISVSADGDRIVSLAVQAYLTGFSLAGQTPVTSGQLAADVEGLPGVRTAGPPVMSGGGQTLDVPVSDGVRARLTSARTYVITPTAGIAVLGETVVDGVVLYSGDAVATSLCDGS